MAKRGSRAQPRGPENGGKGWMSASPMAWVGLVVGVISIGSTFAQWVFTYADLNGRVGRVNEEIARNFKEDYERNKATIEEHARLRASVEGMNKLYTKIEVLEEKLSSIDRTLQRMERQAEKASWKADKEKGK